MADKVFISYASEDEDRVLPLYRALSDRAISCWWAPRSLQPGQSYPKEIVAAIGQCEIFLPVWSANSAKSDNVANEITLAGDSHRRFFPVRLDDTPYTETDAGYFLARLHRIELKQNVQHVAQSVIETLDSLQAAYPLGGRPDQYPFGGLYDRLDSDGPGALGAHIDALRRLCRFVALVHVARYVRVPDRDDKLNRAVEHLFTMNSLFSDLDVAGRLMAWLAARDRPVHPSFREFFKLMTGNLPGVNEFDRAEDAADVFDQTNIHLLLGEADLLGPASSVPPEDAHRLLCQRIRVFLHRALAQAWSHCPLLASMPQPGGKLRIVRIPGPLPSADGPASGSQLGLQLPGEVLELDPFVVLVPTPTGDTTDVGLLESQNGRAYYCRLETRDPEPARRPMVVLPWGRLEIARTLPPAVYGGEVHIVTLRFTNRSTAPVRIPAFDEHLPENLASPAGGSIVRVRADVDLAVDESCELSYEVRGAADRLGAVRAFLPRMVEYEFQGAINTAAIDGDRSVTVQSAPPPGLVIRREMRDWHDEPVGDTVAIDTELSIRVEVRSAGRASPPLRLEETITGGIVIDGQTMLHEGVIDRLDRQPPLQRSYRLRVCGPDALVVRAAVATAADDDGARVEVQEDEIRLGVIRLPPPKLELSWQHAMRVGGHALDLELQLANAGGTIARGIELEADAPAHVNVVFGDDSSSGTSAPLQIDDIHPGTTRTIAVHVRWSGLPSDHAWVAATHRSGAGAPVSTRLPLKLDRVLDPNIGAIAVVGRIAARDMVSRALDDPATRVFNLHGERGVGKRAILLEQLERLRTFQGRAVASYVVDCGMERSLSDALIHLLENIVYGEDSELRGLQLPLAAFLGEIGFDEQQYAGHIEELRQLLQRVKQPHTGTWNAVALLLNRIAAARALYRLVLVLHNVSEFAKKELEIVATLGRFLRSAPNIRLVVTGDAPLGLMIGVDRDVAVSRFSDEDCRTLIGRVFVMPRASSSLEDDLINKSEHVPANLIAILKRLIAEPDVLLDFESPAGVRLADRATFDRLPTTLLESERRNAQRAGIPPLVLSCIAAFREPFTEAQLVALVRHLDTGIPADVVRGALQTCRQRQWVKGHASNYEVGSAITRAALEEVVDATERERIHQRLFEIYHADGRSLDASFTHLVAAPSRFIAAGGSLLIDGLRGLVTRGRFSEVRAVQRRLHDEQIALPSPYDLDLAVIAQEVQWEETATLDARLADELLTRIEALPRDRNRSLLQARLCLILSQWYSHQEQHDEAITVANRVNQGVWGFRAPRIEEPGLEFEFYLNLWQIYYRALDERNFRWVDEWVWKRLAIQPHGQYDSDKIARFLELVLDCHREFENTRAREQHFSIEYVRDPDGHLRPSTHNEIEARTRIDRLEGSFLGQYLQHLDALKIGNRIIVARLCFDLGALLWKQSRETMPSIAAGGQHPLTRDDATSYLERAERLFDQDGVPRDLASVRRTLGQVYQDRLADARTADIGRAIEWCSVAVQWLELSARGFDAIGATEDSTEAWTAYADVMGRWFRLQPDRLPEAIAANTRLLARLDRPERMTQVRHVLIDLYERAERFADVAEHLNALEATQKVLEHRALNHARMLVRDPAMITDGNVRQIERDISTLRRIVAAAPSQESSPFRGTGPDVARNALGVLAWSLADFHRRRQRGTAALQTLRTSRAEIQASDDLRLRLQREGPVVLPELWQMEGTPDAQVTQDFVALMLPFLDDNGPAVKAMLGQLWEWTLGDAQKTPRLAAAEISLVICESSLERGGDAAGQAALAATVLLTLRDFDRYAPAATTSLISRALSVILRAEAGARNEAPFLRELDKVRQTLEQGEHWQAALRLIIDVVETLLQVNNQTREAWYYDVLTTVAVHLPALHERSRHDLELTTRLIALYLQLPRRTPDAIRLMQRQCQRLIEDHNYELLPEYLSFLSDLLMRIESGDTHLESLLRRLRRVTSDRAPGPAEDALPDAASVERSLAEARDTKTVVTTLCANIIADLRVQPIGQEQERHVLYNLGKLFKGAESADLCTAIYVKLYELANSVDGSCVWGTFMAWSSGPSKESALTLADQIALTTYANCTSEESDGSNRYWDAPRNYMINTLTRNWCVRRFSRQTGSRDIQLVYIGLELQRLTYLRSFIARHQEYLATVDAFQRLEWITFFYVHLLPEAEDAPLWQKLQRIDAHGHEIDKEREELFQQLKSYGLLRSDWFETTAPLKAKAQDFVSRYRQHGREIMMQLCERLRPFSLAEILGEVQRFLNNGDRSIDFNAVLGLWPGQGEAATAGAADDFLSQDQGARIAPLSKNAEQLLTHGQPLIAERLYRSALRLTESRGGEAFPGLPALLQGLTQSLAAQKRLDEA